MSNFEEWFLSNGIPLDTDFNVAKRAFEAGQQSQQDKIDELKMSNHHLSVQLVDSNAHYDHVKKERDELQARIDEALRFYNEAKSPHNIGMMQMAIYLKGNKDEN